VTPITPGDAVAGHPYRRHAPSALDSTVAVAAVTVAGCSFGGPSVSDIEKNIETNAPLRLQASSIGGPIQRGTALPPTVSVSCPDNAKLDDGSHFMCKAGVTETGTTTQPGITTHNAVVDVEIDGDKASWELRVTS
jgi:hypothetical protein